ncbi:hypothetical protein Cs7R123_66780 [Catellatospora sp. TT07R-123]|uniref:PIN domain-containing protein n=1 Tax=Catellatospora sp. TT07R-123 TaxID=2733863 RepID=UPI001B18105A|nr:PIN domain-containing protein [Catellatospora sp. TT07R-123]GHJ49336.1 hypothetical protein Cs7R123_66780 [Catellatospora sp. TT07R-123]
MPLAFRDQFAHYLVPTDNDLRTSFTLGTVVVDTNVLFNAYRYTTEASEQLLSALERLEKRIFIPHQVGEEFYRNRIRVMSDLRNGYAALAASIRQAESKVSQELGERINELFKRVSLSDEEKSRLTEALTNAFTPLSRVVSDLQDKHTPVRSFSKDPILDRIESLLNGKIGQPFVDDLAERLAEADRRIKNSEPPGYRDGNKDQSHGDYFVWAQTLEHAKRAGASHILLVTGDEKEDWFRQVNRKIVSARPELVKEAREYANCHLVILNVGEFLKSAKRFLDAEVSEATIRQAEVPASIAANVGDLEIENLAALAERMSYEIGYHSAELESLQDSERRLEMQSRHVSDERNVFLKSPSGVRDQDGYYSDLYELDSKARQISRLLEGVSHRRRHLESAILERRDKLTHIEAELVAWRAQQAKARSLHQRAG